MDNNVVTALMAKLELLFGGAEEDFLAFQIPGVPVSPDSLRFSPDGEETGLSPQEALNAAADFSRLVNLVPSVSSRMSSDGRMLWSVYETVLTQAVVASGGYTEAEKAELQKAKELLNSQKWGTYKRYQAAYWAAEEQYRNTQLSMENSSDPKLKEKLSSQLAQLEARKNQAFGMWVSRGFKDGIERALAVVEQVSGRNPQLVWQQWRQNFPLSVKTDLRGHSFYETYLWPANFLDADSPTQWTELRMDASEIQALSAMATDPTHQLVTEMATDPDPSAEAQALELDISHLSIELARVEVIRPWCDPLVFNSRAWKWPDEREPLSDGQDPPRGSLPAYITAIVFARNLEIELKQDLEPNQRIVDILQAGQLAFVGPLALTSVAPAASVGAVAKLNAATLTPLSLNQVSSALIDVADSGSAELGPVVAAEARPAIDPASMVDLLSTTAETTTPPQQAETAPAPETTSTSEGQEGAQIIAFVCHKLPKSPDPDPTLDWPSDKRRGGKRGRRGGKNRR
jgi:hypothetical protein